MSRFPSSKLQYIRGGTRYLALQPVATIPERLTRTWMGTEYRGDDPVVRHLPGRVHNNICYRHVDLVLTMQENSALRAVLGTPSLAREAARFFVTYTTGLGTQHFEVHCYALQGYFRSIMDMPEDMAHGLVLSLVQAQLEGAGYGYQEAQARYTQAFVEGTLRKRKQRGQDQVKVWIVESSWEGRVQKVSDGKWQASIAWLNEDVETLVLHSQNTHEEVQSATDEAMVMLGEKAPEQTARLVRVIG